MERDLLSFNTVSMKKFDSIRATTDRIWGEARPGVENKDFKDLSDCMTNKRKKAPASIASVLDGLGSVLFAILSVGADQLNDQ
jgi:hypothetical protein